MTRFNPVEALALMAGRAATRGDLDGRSAWDAWLEVLRIDPTADYRGRLATFWRLQELFDDSARRTRSLPDYDPELHGAWIPMVDAALRHDTDLGSFATARACLGGWTLASLRAAAAGVARGPLPPTLELATALELRDEVARALAALRPLEIASESAVALGRALESVSRSIIDLDRFGPTSLRRATVLAVGELLLGEGRACLAEPEPEEIRPTVALLARVWCELRRLAEELTVGPIDAPGADPFALFATELAAVRSSGSPPD